jgi:hypothetical protein
MGSVKSKDEGGRMRDESRAARPRKLHSDLGKKVWAVITHADGVTGNLTHGAAMKLAKKTGGYVTTREAISRCD